MRALQLVSYGGAVIVECTAPGPDPFTPVKGVGWREELRKHLLESVLTLRQLESAAAT